MNNKIIISTIILLTSLLTPLVHAQAPFIVTVEPETANASPGDPMEYTITIEAYPEFEESIYLELEINALSYHEVYMIDTVFPPYPVEINYVFPVPEDIPGDVTAYGTVRAISGEIVVEQEVTLKISSGGILGAIIGWILGVLNSIRNFFS
jgi:hypothetical protein